MKKSPNDSKQYQPLTLDNGLRVLLVHNNETKKSAAALAVNVGHFDDPKDREGLAHFLEHMLFLGTKSYPDGSEYQKYISQHAGNHNAWTATEHTCFFLDIHQDHFAEALHRFSQFFISPLLSKKFVDQERQNVDAEFKLKLKDDIRRLYDVHKETINQAHPFAKFSVGSIDTLADREGNDLTAEVRQFFQTHYRANLMTLVLEGPQTLTQLAKFAEENFSEITPGSAPRLSVSTPLYLPEHQKVLIKVKPVKNDRQLIVSFAMPSIDEFYRNKPETILSYLLGHEGCGSVLSYLKNKQWALSLTAGSGVNGSNFKDFNISIALTELGESHIDQIIDCIFSYINIVKQAPLAEFYYQEKQAISSLSFRYQEKLAPLDSVCQLVINMQHYPEKDYIYGDYVMESMCNKEIDGLLAYLSPENMRIVHISHENEFDQTSRWYNVPYSVAPIAEKKISDWLTLPAYSALHLPKANPYIVKNPRVYESIITQAEQFSVPELVENSDGLSVWFKQDNTFKVPKGYTYLGIDAPLTLKDNQHIAMTRLFVDLYSDAVIEQHYNTELAGIHYHLYSHQGGLTLQLSGMSENQDKLLAQLLNSLRGETFSEDKFNLFKAQLLNHWQNAKTSKSIAQLFSILSSTMQPKNPTNEELADAMAEVSFEQFCQFRQNIFNEITLEALVHGNWQLAHVQQFCKIIQEKFSPFYTKKHQVKIPVVDISGLGEIDLPLHLPEHDHATVIYYPMLNRDLLSVAKTMITSQVLSPLFFQEMRTEKQYGYLVGVGFIPINRYPGIAFYIQSPHIEAEELTQAISDFINQACSNLKQLSSEDWQHLQQGLAGQLQEKDSSLRIKSQRFWSSICNKEIKFDQKQRLIDSILSLTIDDIIVFVEQQLILTKDRILLTSLQHSMSEKEQKELQQQNQKIQKTLKKCQRKY